MRKTAMIVLASAFVAVAPDVYAQATPEDIAMAKDYFVKGMEAMNAKDYATACPLLAGSDRLDPLPTTKGNLAVCYENQGRIASAWKLFEAVAVGYQQLGNANLADVAQKRADNLYPKLPRIKIVLPVEHAVSGLVVERDGELVNEVYLGKEVPVDPGAHTIRATAIGKKAWEKSESLAEKEIRIVTIPVLEDLPKVETKPPPNGVIWRPTPNEGMQRAALGLGVLGLAGTLIGSITGAVAISEWDPDVAKNHCVNGDHDKCDSEAMEVSGRVGTLSSVSTGAFIGGGVSLAAASVFWYLSKPPSPKSASAQMIVLPTVAPGQLSALVRIQF